MAAAGDNFRGARVICYIRIKINNLIEDYSYVHIYVFMYISALAGVRWEIKFT